MIAQGHVAIVVSDVDAALRFYTEILGLSPGARFAGHWAIVQAPGLTIGLHPPSKHYPPPGTKGAMMIGLEIAEDIEVAVARLTAKGVGFTGPIVRDPRAGAFANFTDPDGNSFYLWQVAWRG